MSSQVTASGKPRQRSALACNLCRTKRIKCDGQRPSCTSCNASGEVCEYTSQESNRKPPSKRYVEALQERIKALESQLERFQQGIEFHDLIQQHQFEQGQSTSEVESLSDDANSTHRSPIKDISDRLGNLNIGEDGQIHYFGSRSNFSLLKNSPAASSTISSHELEKQAADTLERLDLRVEVSDELRDHLLDIFWSWQNTWQYIVVKELFLEDLCISHSGQYASPLLLSSVLALAARYSDRVELRSDPLDSNTAGNALAEQAKMILFYESQAPKITTIQAAALLSLRETATDKEALGWMYCGMATRMAFNLGLHLDCSNWCETGRITKEAAEFRSVVWWACYVLDKLFNVGLGRPSTIQEIEISAALPSTQHEAEYGPWSPTSQIGQQVVFPSSHMVSNVRATVQLFKITASALDEIYRPSSLRTSSRAADLVTRTHVDLMEFQTNLPSCLRLSTSPFTPTLPHVYLLHLQYHVAVILLHRPFIRVRRNRSDSGAFHPDIGSTHLKQCSLSAQSITNIFKLYCKHYSLRRIPISAVHCAFTASIILLLETTISHESEKCRALASLKILAEALTDMSIAWAWSRRALLAIRQLAQEWSACEETMNALGINKTTSDSGTEDVVSDVSQTFNIWDPSVSLWSLQGPQSIGEDIPFSITEELEYQNWVGRFLNESHFSGNSM